MRVTSKVITVLFTLVIIQEYDTHLRHFFMSLRVLH